jgi:hypothetical protein
MRSWKNLQNYKRKLFSGLIEPPQSKHLITLAVFEGFHLPCPGVKHFVNTEQVIGSETVIRRALKTR